MLLRSRPRGDGKRAEIPAAVEVAVPAVDAGSVVPADETVAPTVAGVGADDTQAEDEARVKAEAVRPVAPGLTRG